MISKHKIIKSSSSSSLKSYAGFNVNMPLKQSLFTSCFLVATSSFWDEDIYAHINYWQVYGIEKDIQISKAAS
jgi:hypothetical protein